MKVAVNNRHQNDDSLRLSIKDEIRHQIQNRRLSQGLEKLEVDFIPKPKYPVSLNSIVVWIILNEDGTAACHFTKSSG